MAAPTLAGNPDSASDRATGNTSIGRAQSAVIAAGADDETLNEGEWDETRRNGKVDTMERSWEVMSRR